MPIDAAMLPNAARGRPGRFRRPLSGLPRNPGTAAWPEQAAGFSHYRRFYMGLIRADGTAKLALEHFARHTPAMGIMQWFHSEDSRPDDPVRRLLGLGAARLRTGPEDEGLAPHHTSPPKDPMYFADICARMIERFASARPVRPAQQRAAA